MGHTVPWNLPWHMTLFGSLDTRLMVLIPRVVEGTRDRTLREGTQLEMPYIHMGGGEIIGLKKKQEDPNSSQFSVLIGEQLASVIPKSLLFGFGRHHFMVQQ